MTDFKRLTDTVWASPQLTESDINEAAAQGFGLIVNNRPDGESEDQPRGEAIEHAARDKGMDYVAIPVGHSGFSQPQVDAMARALEKADGKILAYCRSGTRSTYLWALAEAHRGKNADTLTRAAASAGYDISGIRPTLEMLAVRNSD
ncbi:TIGR01244 family sulfur transferase [Aurantiacibacter odishensis]|uniref:TIGR01244 family sulfur transferase n=1 Tax=Aurantiacibacter odishensis TaxID=1155476 RepID=UPI000E71CC0A|nr:TIGR01244 family sulfur transferase [Aurantiacibacter odishensis]